MLFGWVGGWKDGWWDGETEAEKLEKREGEIKKMDGLSLSWWLFRGVL